MVKTAASPQKKATTKGAGRSTLLGVGGSSSTGSSGSNGSSFAVSILDYENAPSPLWIRVLGVVIFIIVVAIMIWYLVSKSRGSSSKNDGSDLLQDTSSPSASEEPTESVSGDASSPSSLGTRAIVGAVAGSIAGVVILIFVLRLIFKFIKRRWQARQLHGDLDDLEKAVKGRVAAKVEPLNELSETETSSFHGSPSTPNRDGE